MTWYSHNLKHILYVYLLILLHILQNLLFQKTWNLHDGAKIIRVGTISKSETHSISFVSYKEHFHLAFASSWLVCITKSSLNKYGRLLCGAGVEKILTIKLQEALFLDVKCASNLAVIRNNKMGAAPYFKTNFFQHLHHTVGVQYVFLAYELNRIAAGIL